MNISEKKYKIKQYSFGLSIDENKLSKEQKYIRKNSIPIIYKKTKKCKNCLKRQSINEFWFSCKIKKIKHSICRDCKLRKKGTKEIGKNRFSKKILLKGFRRCTTCKNIKSLQKFCKSKNRFGGHDHHCKNCQNKYHLKNSNAKNPGKNIFSKKILLNGFRCCTSCKKIKSLKQFHKSKNVNGNHSHHCINCCSKQSALRYIKNKKINSDKYKHQIIYKKLIRLMKKENKL